MFVGSENKIIYEVSEIMNCHFCLHTFSILLYTGFKHFALFFLYFMFVKEYIEKYFKAYSMLF